MNPWRIAWRLVGRPLVGDPGRTLLTVLAISLGVAVVVAIDLAGAASVGSFRSSMESLTGDADYEVSAVVGMDERLLADLAALPYDLAFSPRVEGWATDIDTGQTAPLFGLDLLGGAGLSDSAPSGTFDLANLHDDRSVWVGRRLAEQPGQTLRLRINDRVREFIVRGVLDQEGFQGFAVESVVVMDIAAAQRILDKRGRLDRLQVYVPDDAQNWPELLSGALPPGIEIDPAGTATESNRKMLGAFRWNLRVLSYLSLIVGGFLIYNTVAVSVVRRRGEIGILRALGATRNFVRWAFLAEAAAMGAAGAAIGLAAGRWLAGGAVAMMSKTVETLYVTSAPGEIRIGAFQIGVAALAGVGVALLSAWQPASEAARVAPTEAMARGRRDFESRLRVRRDLTFGLLLLGAGTASAFAPAVDGLPVFGYVASVLFIAASAMMIPAVVQTASRWGSPWASGALGVEGFLGSRSVASALSRTSILVGALSTAIAMMVSIAIMVGSFRETVLVWMDNQIRADLYIRAAGEPAQDRLTTIAASVADRIEALDGVEEIDRFRAYRIQYNGLPATLAGGDARIHGAHSGLRFLSGDKREILDKMQTGDFAIVSEPFARKHNVWTGDEIRLPLAGREAVFRTVGVYYDYSSERGSIILDRQVLLRYLPDANVTNIAVYLKPGADPEEARERVIQAAAGHDLYVVTNAGLRREAIAVFDRTFAITYALEAIAVAVAILGMAGALVALVIDRKREISVLRFLGASQGQIRKLILAESGLLGLLSIGVGVMLGTALSLVLVFVINRQSFGWTIQFHWPVGLLIGALGFIYAASLAAGLYPAGLAARLNPIEAVHEE